jgi:hypothetical protein
VRAEMPLALLFSPKRRAKSGPKGPNQDLIRAVVDMKQRNPRRGCPRAAEQIELAFGIPLKRCGSGGFLPPTTNLLQVATDLSASPSLVKEKIAVTASIYSAANRQRCAHIRCCGDGSVHSPHYRIRNSCGIVDGPDIVPYNIQVRITMIAAIPSMATRT